MAINQLAAVTGRRVRRRPFRPSSELVLSTLAERFAREQREEELAAQEEFRQEQLDLEKKAFRHGKTQAQIGTGIALTGLGLQAGMLYPQYKSLQGQNALTGLTAPTVGGAMVGGLAGAMAGKAFGGKDWQKGLVGAGVGGGLGYYASGGDPYSAAAGAILGGGGSMLF